MKTHERATPQVDLKKLRHYQLRSTLPTGVFGQTHLTLAWDPAGTIECLLAPYRGDWLHWQWTGTESDARGFVQALDAGHLPDPLARSWREALASRLQKLGRTADLDTAVHTSLTQSCPVLRGAAEGRGLAKIKDLAESKQTSALATRCRFAYQVKPRAPAASAAWG